MLDQFHQGRAFVLEAVVVVILVVELVYLFHGQVVYRELSIVEKLKQFG